MGKGVNLNNQKINLKYSLMKNNLDMIPRVLNSKNIDKAIHDYNELLKGIPLELKSNDVLHFLQELKRGKLKNGPFPGISIFEAANRIMTDLTILYGVRDLLKGVVEEIKFDSYTVEFENENRNDHDIMADNSEQKLIGEAFNVAKSFFYTKKSSVLKKLKRSVKRDTILLLLFNEDALPEKYNTEKLENEFHLAVKIF